MKNETIESILTLAGYNPDFIKAIPDTIKAINDLTGAEIKFFFDCRSGNVNLNTPLSSTAINGSLKDKIIRSELLEWTLTPEMSAIFFPQGTLVLSDAIIDRYIELRKNFKYSVDSINTPDSKIQRKNILSYSLDLSYCKIDIDLIFLRCIIRGGVNFRGAVTKSLVFNKTRIGYTKEEFDGNPVYLSFNGNDLHVQGDLKINSWVDPHDSTSKIISQIDNAKQGIQVFGVVRLYYSTISRQLNFDDLVLGKWAEIDTYFLEANSLFMNDMVSESSISLTYAKITTLFVMTRSVILGQTNDGYSVDATRIAANDIFIREGVKLKHGLSLASSYIASLDLTGVFLFANKKNDIAINLRGASIKEDVFFASRGVTYDIEHNSSTIFGKVLLDNATLKNLDFFRIKIIYKLNETALSVNNATVYGRITFSRGKQLNSPKFDNFRNADTNTLYVKIRKKREAYNRYAKFRQSKKEALFFVKSELKEEDNISFGDFLAYLYIPNQLDSFRTPQVQKNEGKTNASEKDGINEDEESAPLPNELLWMQDYKNAYEYLYNEIEEENPEKSIEEKGEILVETATIIGEASFTSLICKEQLDCASAFFYGMDPGDTERLCKSPKGDFVAANALSLNYASISGQLFLNEGADYKRPFRAYGKVNLHSSKVEQFFISPKRGSNENVQWKLVGMKYEYIYSNEIEKTTDLEKCEWFHDYEEENNRQPYEQLALAYFKAGDDTKARRVLTRTVARDDWEKGLMRVLSFFVWTGSPPYMALAAFAFIGVFGFLVFSYSAQLGGIVPINVNATVINLGPASKKIEFSPLGYSFQQIIPFIPFDQKNLFAPSYSGTGILTAGYQFFHSLLGAIYLTMFIIGITRVVRRH